MSYLYFVRRYFIGIILIGILGLGLGFYKIYKSGFETTYKTSKFFVVAIKSDNSSIQEIEEASTNFGQTIMGWFRNEPFIDEILGGTNLKGIKINAYKQERQNMIIEVSSSSQTVNEELIKSSINVLNNKIYEYNEKSNVKYMVLDQGKTLSKSVLKNIIYPLFGFLFGILVGIIIFSLFELINGSIKTVEEIENILETKTLDIISSNWYKNDYTLLSVVMQKIKSLIILAGVNINTDILAVLIAQRQSFFGENIALVDGDLQRRSLQNTLGLSSRLKNLKGFTDVKHDTQNEEKEEIDEKKSLIFLQNTLDENLKFVPAGSGNKFLVQIFTNISKQMKTLIHTQLPENFEVLRLQNASLVLVIKLGITKIREIKRIKEVWNDEIKVIVVK